MKGVLTQKELNSVQESLLIVVTVRKNKEKQDLENARFEQSMLITNPEMYKHYIKQKEEDINSGNAGVTWVAPETFEEAQELAGLFSDIDKQIKDSKQDLAADEDFIKQVEMMQLFDGINLDEIGGE